MTRHHTKRTEFTSPFDAIPGKGHWQDTLQSLKQTEGIVFTGGDRGTVDLGKSMADLALDVDGSIRVRAEASYPGTPLQALQATCDLPGNMRYARDRHGDSLVADTQVDGQAHLPFTFQSIRRALMDTLHRNATDDSPSSHCVDSNFVHEALSGLPWPEDWIVEQDGRWELRPHLHSSPMAVSMTIRAGELHLAHVLLADLPPANSDAAHAVADQAVRINTVLRHARLSVEQGQLSAEARLPVWLIQPHWLATAAYAVSSAAWYATVPLRLLAEQPQTTAAYIMMFCSVVERPVLQSAGG